MVRITITAAAYEAIAATLPFGSVGIDREADAKGERQIWLEPRVLDRLKAMRRPGDSYSDVILRLAKGSSKRAARRGGFRAALLSRARLPLITYTRKGPSYTFQIQLYAPGLSNPSDS